MENPNRGARELPRGKTTAGTLTSGERRTHSRETGHSTGGRCGGSSGKTGTRGRGCQRLHGAVVYESLMKLT